MTNRVHRQSFPASGVSPAGDHTQRPAGVRSLDNTLAVLEHLDQSNLQMRWRELFGRKAPARLGADLLRRAIAYRIQELELGGLTRQAQLRLKATGGGRNKLGSGRGRTPSSSLVKPGTRFVREWQNEVHEVLAIDTGDFIYRGKAYRSLSLIAREITGTHHSGPRFFGIRSTDSAARKREAVNG